MFRASFVAWPCQSNHNMALSLKICISVYELESGVHFVLETPFIGLGKVQTIFKYCLCILGWKSCSQKVMMWAYPVECLYRDDRWQIMSAHLNKMSGDWHERNFFFFHISLKSRDTGTKVGICVNEVGGNVDRRLKSWFRNLTKQSYFCSFQTRCLLEVKWIMTKHRVAIKSYSCSFSYKNLKPIQDFTATLDIWYRWSLFFFTGT